MKNNELSNQPLEGGSFLTTDKLWEVISLQYANVTIKMTLFRLFHILCNTQYKSYISNKCMFMCRHHMPLMFNMMM